ncbi:hypothetical protein RP20_CCG015183 [Aedes albopictus]|nr:hypothetical protein RP20_CCG015183 [Aedes albopictus]
MILAKACSTGSPVPIGRQAQQRLTLRSLALTTKFGTYYAVDMNNEMFVVREGKLNM